MENWFLAYTKPKHEDSVSYLLGNAGFNVMNPKISEEKLYRGRITEVVSPLFPCYLFIEFDKTRDYHLIRYTRGIKKILSGDDGPVEVPGHIIETIAKKTEAGAIRLEKKFSPGDSVHVNAGPFEGFNAVFEREMKGIERVSILLTSINVRLVVDGRILTLL